MRPISTLLFTLTILWLCAGVAVAQDKIQYPLDVARAADGTLYVADSGLPGIWKVSGDKLEVFFKGSKKFNTPLNRIRCVAVDGDNRVLAGCTQNREVYRFDESGKPVPLANGTIGMPMGLAVGSDGTIHVSDLETHALYRITKDGKVERYAEVVAPGGIDIDGANRVWVVSRGKHHLRRVSGDGQVEVVVEKQPFEFPNDVTLLDDKTAIVSDGYGKCLWKVAEGEAPAKWSQGDMFKNPVGLTSADGKVWTADSRAAGIMETGADGTAQPLLK